MDRFFAPNIFLGVPSTCSSREMHPVLRCDHLPSNRIVASSLVNCCVILFSLLTLFLYFGQSFISYYS